MKKQPSTSYVMKAKASECVNEHAELGGITTGDVANHVLPYASPKEGWWSIDCSHRTGEQAAICGLQVRLKSAT